MRKWIFISVCFFCWLDAFAGKGELNQYFLLLSRLEFDSAKHIAHNEKELNLRAEMLQLAEILFYEGQIDQSKFNVAVLVDQRNVPLSVINALSHGYFNLFYDRIKGNAYRYFYDAYQLAKRSDDRDLQKVCLLALLRYYNSEVGQNVDYHLPYLRQFENLASNSTDSFWLTIYKLSFFTQSFQNLDDEYFKLSATLDSVEHTLASDSPLLTSLFYEKAIQFDLQKKAMDASLYYRKSIAQAKQFPFLRYYRFNGSLRLLLLEINQGNIKSAKKLLLSARNEIDQSDSVRSSYSLNLHSALFMKAQKKYDSAFDYLLRAQREELQLGFTKNSLEISRLNVELETQEKENTNLQLKQNRNWLISALVGVGFLFLTSYFAYANQRSKNRIQAKEKEVQAMKLEKVLKDQEIISIDAMIEGQEKERQRIASELHDNLGSLLATIKLHFHHIRVNMEGNEAAQNSMLQKTEDLLSEAYQKVRGMAHAGNVGVNAKEGLLPAVTKFASKISISNELKIEVKEHGMDQRLENSLEITVFRMIQELIANVIKHAHATEVVISLTHYDQSINLMVEDNGIGFDISQIKPQETMGLHSIQKRMESLGGSVTIDSIPQKGTSIIIDIPIV